MTENLLEVEMKFPAVDFAVLESRLQEWHTPLVATRQEVDHYFNAPDRDFACTDEGLRLRRVGRANFVTYKGPKRDAQTKTHTEIEVPLCEGDRAAEDFAALLTCLGYRPVLVVKKSRRIYRLNREGFTLEVCLDEVEDLGRFAELEIIASVERQDLATHVLLRTAADLGLSTSERRSYLELLLAKQVTTSHE